MPVYNSTIYNKSNRYYIYYQKPNREWSHSYYTSRSFKNEEQFKAAIEKLQASNKYSIGEIQKGNIDTYIFIEKK